MQLGNSLWCEAQGFFQVSWQVKHRCRTKFCGSPQETQFLCGAAWSQELDLMILVGPFQPEMFCDSKEVKGLDRET